VALVEGCKHSLEITVPAAEVEAETERAVARIQSRAHLRGFRPGKAPLGVIRAKFAGDIRQEVIEALVPRYFREAAEQEHLEVVGRPDVRDVHFHSGEPLTFKAEFEVAPSYELGDYRGITVTYGEPSVTDADVDERIESIRQQKAEYVNEEPRALAEGDFAVVSLESLEGVDEKVSQDEMMVEIGGQATMTAFSDNLRGASPEEQREFEITYPEDYEREALAGRTVKFRARIKAVRRKELPELNDEFAKDLGDFQTLDELKGTVRATILRERENQAQEAAKHQLLDKLVDAHDFAVPEAYVDRQIEINVENQLRQLAAQGVDPRQLKLDWHKLKASQSERATRDVKASLLLDKIAEREAIGPTQEEMDQEVARIARQKREAVAVTRANLQKDGGLARIAGHIRTEKTISFLFEQARKEAPKPGEEPAGEGEAEEQA
jgi:trigger factor